jgi:hypothetical protein
MRDPFPPFPTLSHPFPRKGQAPFPHSPSLRGEREGVEVERK